MEYSHKIRRMLSICCALLAFAVLLGLSPLTVNAQEQTQETEQVAPAQDEVEEMPSEAQPVEQYEPEAYAEPIPDAESNEEPLSEHTEDELPVPQIQPEPVESPDETGLEPELAADVEETPVEELDEPAQRLEPGIVDIASRDELRAALAQALDGDILLLHNDVELADGALTAIPNGVSITLAADENGPYALYTAANRHIALRGAQDMAFEFNGVSLAGASGGIELENCSNITLNGLEAHSLSAQSGAALYVSGSENVVLYNASLTGHTADEGGAVAVYGSTLALRDVLLQGNQAGRGGALYADAASSVALESTTLSENNATSGGAVYLQSHDTLTADATTGFYGNEAAEGHTLRDEVLLALHATNIASLDFSGGYETAYNNHDISYEGGDVVLPEQAGPTRRQQREQQTHAEMGRGYGFWQSSYDATAIPGAGNGLLLNAYAEAPLQTATHEYRYFPAENEEEGSWALLTVLLGLLGFTVSVLLLIGMLSRRSKACSVHQPYTLRGIWHDDKLGFFWGIVGSGAGFGLLLVVVATQTGGTMQLADRLTPAVAGILLMQCTCVALLRLNGQTQGSPGRYWSGVLNDFTWE